MKIKRITTNIRTLGMMLLIAGVCEGAQNGRTADQAALGKLWHSSPGNELRQSLGSGLGFSFNYGGQTFGPLDWTGWKVNQQGLITTLRHPSGLTVVRTAKLWADFEAIEYTVEFRNEGTTDLPNLSKINAVDVGFKRPNGQVDTVISSAGAARKRRDPFPPETNECFTITRTALEGTQSSVSFSGEKGRPSRHALPFFFVENDAQNAGLFVGMGWPGQWQAKFDSDPHKRRLSIQGGIEGVDISLKPGEQISGPSILLGSWSGPLDEGTNRLRRLLGEHYVAKPKGEKLVPPVLYTTWFQIGSELDEPMAMTLIDRAAEMGQEIFLIDASWYNGTPTAPFSDMSLTWPAISNSLGNWEEGHDPKRFPNGLGVLADRVREKGMKFGLWFEPERAGKPSRLAREHPEWVTTIPDSKWLMVDMGLPEVQEYFCNIFDRYIEELDIKYIRFDMNHIDILSHWQTKDTPNRVGLTQIRYIEGLRRIEDYLLEKHPDVLIENCASGGERIDLTSLTRRHTMWVSDAIDTKIVRFMLEGLNQFIPGNGQLDCLSIPVEDIRNPDFVLRDYNAQVCFGGAFGLSGRIHEWSSEIRKTVRRNVDVFKQLRHHLAEDFYLLVPQARTEETWAGWQFHNPETQEGFVQVFRVKSPQESRTFKLKGIDPGKTYTLWDPYTNERFDMQGATLRSKGLHYELPKETSRVLIYEPTDT